MFVYHGIKNTMPRSLLNSCESMPLKGNNTHVGFRLTVMSKRKIFGGHFRDYLVRASTTPRTYYQDYEVVKKN